MQLLRHFFSAALALSALSIASSSACEENAVQKGGKVHLVEIEPSLDLDEFTTRVQAQTGACIRRRLDYALFKSFSWMPPTAADADWVKDMAGVKEVTLMDVDIVTWGSRPAPSEHSPIAGHESELQRRSVPEEVVQLKPLHASSWKTTNKAHTMMQIDRLLAMNVTGRGSKIAILDSGVDYGHPALGGCFGPGCPISFGANLVSGEDPSDLTDVLGHGTMVAGIVAAREPNAVGLLGAAPGAEVGMYRVGGGDGFTCETVVEAIYRAQDEDVNIINFSAGDAANWTSGCLGEVASRVIEAGVIFVAAAGNSGDRGSFSVLEPASELGVISVGGVVSWTKGQLETVDTKDEDSYTVDGRGPIPLDIRSSSQLREGKKEFMARFTGRPMELYSPCSRSNYTPREECGEIPPRVLDRIPDLSNRIMLLRECFSLIEGDPERAPEIMPGLGLRMDQLAAKGARRLLHYDAKQSGWFFNQTLDSIIAYGAVPDDVGTELLDTLRAGRSVFVTAHSRADPESVLRAYREMPNPLRAGAIYARSSWGPAWDMSVNPTTLGVADRLVTTAPGHIYPDGFAVVKGTSGAAPLVACAAALIAEARQSHEPALIRNLLTVYSSPQLYHDGDQFQSYRAPVSQQGGGLLRAFDAAMANTTVELPVTGLSFNDTEHAVRMHEFRLSNLNSRDGIQYNLTKPAAASVYILTAAGAVAEYPKSLELVEAGASVFLSRDSLALAPGQSAKVLVVAQPPESVDPERLALWSGWISIKGSDGSSLNIPYQGLMGSLRQQQVLPPDGVSLLYNNETVTGSTSIQLPPRFSDKKSRLAIVLAPGLGSPRVHAYVVPSSPGSHGDDVDISAAIGQIWGFPMGYRFSLREFDERLGMEPPWWNGRLDNRWFVPEGSYRIVVKALRIFGDPANATDWDMAVSTTFSIRYEDEP